MKKLDTDLFMLICAFSIILFIYGFSLVKYFSQHQGFENLPTQLNDGEMVEIQIKNNITKKATKIETLVRDITINEKTGEVAVKSEGVVLVDNISIFGARHIKPLFSNGTIKIMDKDRNVIWQGIIKDGKLRKIQKNIVLQTTE